MNEPLKMKLTDPKGVRYNIPYDWETWVDFPIGTIADDLVLIDNKGSGKCGECRGNESDICFITRCSEKYRSDGKDVIWIRKS